MPVADFSFQVPKSHRPIVVGEPLEKGDVFTRNGFRVVVGTINTPLKPGDPCPQNIMCYFPMRRLPDPPPQ